MSGCSLSTASIIVVVVGRSFIVVLEPVRQVLWHELRAAELLKRRSIHALARAK